MKQSSNENTVFDVVNFIDNPWLKITDTGVYRFNVADYDELSNLLEDRNIKVTGNHQGLYNLNYDQINSPTMDDLVSLCRGTVINENCEIVAMAFPRFHNYTSVIKKFEDSKDEICITEKLDGTMIKIYYHDGKWLVGTRGEVATTGVNKDSGFTFYSMMLLALGLKNKQEFHEWCELNLSPDCTYIFELVSQYNKVVVKYDETKLYLLGRIRTKNLHDLPEIKDNVTNQDIGIYTPGRGTISVDNVDVKDLNKWFRHISTTGVTGKEGHVIYRNSLPLAKLKYVSYVTIHLLQGDKYKDDLDKNNIRERLLVPVLNNEVPELITYLPEYSDDINKLNHDYELTIDNLYGIVTTISDNILRKNPEAIKLSEENLKTIGSIIKGTVISGWLFVLIKHLEAIGELFGSHQHLEKYLKNWMKMTNSKTSLGIIDSVSKHHNDYHELIAKFREM